MAKTLACVLLSALVVVTCIRTSQGACATAGPDRTPLCCVGKDNTCVTEGYPQYSRTFSTCYCDSTCELTGDCCTDYERACPKVDCDVSPWSSWTGCSQQCGLGYSERRRYVLSDPQNSGAECPKLREVRGCKGYRGCDTDSVAGNSVAMILPYKYSLSRVGPLWEHPLARPPRYQSYCVYFKFKRFHPTCEARGGENWTTSLKKGSKACVECNRPAHGSTGVCRGEGIQKQKTRWMSIDIQGCKGVWQRYDVVKDCECGEDEENRFIFV